MPRSQADVLCSGAFPSPWLPSASHYSPVVLCLSSSWLTWFHFQFIRWPFSSSEQVSVSCPAINLDSLGSFSTTRRLLGSYAELWAGECRCPRRGGRARCHSAGTCRTLGTSSQAPPDPAKPQFWHTLTLLLRMHILVFSWEFQPITPINFFDTNLSFKFAWVSFRRFLFLL